MAADYAVTAQYESPHVQYNELEFGANSSDLDHKIGMHIASSKRKRDDDIMSALNSVAKGQKVAAAAYGEGQNGIIDGRERNVNALAKRNVVQKAVAEQLSAVAQQVAPLILDVMIWHSLVHSTYYTRLI
jgi:hypothetical protein